MALINTLVPTFHHNSYLKLSLLLSLGRPKNRPHLWDERSVHDAIFSQLSPPVLSYISRSNPRGLRLRLFTRTVVLALPCFREIQRS
jgi:hypothetical protein